MVTSFYQKFVRYGLFLPQKERERSQGTVRWTQIVRAVLDEVTRNTLYGGKHAKLLSCLTGEGWGRATPDCSLRCSTSLYNQPFPKTCHIISHYSFLIIICLFFKPLIHAFIQPSIMILYPLKIVR